MSEVAFIRNLFKGGRVKIFALACVVSRGVKTLFFRTWSYK